METSFIAGARHRVCAGRNNDAAGLSASAARASSGDGLGAREAEYAVSVCDGLIELLGETLDVPTHLFRARSRCSASIARARQVGMYLAHVSLGLTMTQVAIGFTRHKSTVVHACHMIEDLRDDEDFDAFIARHERIIRIILEGNWNASSINQSN